MKVVYTLRIYIEKYPKDQSNLTEREGDGYGPLKLKLTQTEMSRRKK